MKTRKELKTIYRQQRPTMGVYQIKNTVNGKIFIEGSTDVLSKWNRHQTELKFGSHRNKQLQKDWKEFKADKFTFEIIAKLDYAQEDTLDYRKEVKVLEEMVWEEMNIAEVERY